MSEQRVVVTINGIDTREQVDSVERNLEELGGIEIHTLGIGNVEMTYDQQQHNMEQISRAISREAT